MIGTERKIVAISIICILLLCGYYAIRTDAQDDLIAEQLKNAQQALYEKNIAMTAQEGFMQAQLQLVKSQKVENTREIIKYVKSDHVNCNFDADRVRIKQNAIDSANNITKPDDASRAMQGK